MNVNEFTPTLLSRSPTMFRAECRAAGVIPALSVGVIGTVSNQTFSITISSSFTQKIQLEPVRQQNHFRIASNGFTFQNGRRAVCGGGERCRRCRQFVGIDRLRRNDRRFGRIRFLMSLDGFDLFDQIDAILLVVRCFVNGPLPHLQFLFQFCQKENREASLTSLRVWG
jgi:hypothetical protein